MMTQANPLFRDLLMLSIALTPNAGGVKGC